MTEDEFQFWQAAYIAALASTPENLHSFRPIADRATSIANAALYDWREAKRKVVTNEAT